MTPNKKQCILERLDNVLFSLRKQNSGRNIHEVGNFRNTAHLLICEVDSISEEMLEIMTKRLENRVVNFFQLRSIDDRFESG